ncbi:hypothetical protein LV164_000313 [Aspergillus fumigatus]|nr:hypothetical protein KXX57_008613 [Aspergillus fumigatus]KAH2307628.1 hypothetical protein KXV47_006976 [Aspergillus fumigatus]KAH2662843.1 hypothetical protein KXV32_008904 [Aspergillus fumigatus]KAH2764605.1 hypothetical protein KXV94_005154 [Aspergillus fumigatus]KAH3530784.1 hypothetical protein KXV64_002373 [Aspergillus fumigatus]
MPRGTKIPKTRWSHSEKRRLLNYRDAHPDLPWEQIKLAFPGRSGTALCKQYSDLKIDREKGAQKKANNGNEETEEMTNNQNNVTNTTQLSKGNKRLLHLGDNETRPSKQTKTGDVAANSDNDPDFDPSEDSDSDGGDISPAASGLKRPSKSTKLQFTGKPGARNSFSTTPASPDPRTLQNATKSTKTTELAPNSSQPTLSNSRTPDNAADTNKSDATSEIVSTVQRAPPNSSPANTHCSLPNQESTTDKHLPSKPEDKMAPRPPTPPFPATTGFTESGNNGYPLMQHGALLFVQAGFAMRDLPRERARNAQLDERNENLVMEVLKLKEKEAEWRQEIEELQLHNKNLEGDLKKQIDQNKKLEAGLKELSEKKNQGALDSANGATNAKCEHCLEHLTRINTLTEENKKMKQRCKVLAEAFAAGNDQA